MKKELDTPDQVSRCDDYLTVSLWYPQLEGKAKEIVVELIDVRAADDVHLRFDFERNGWVITRDPQSGEPGGGKGAVPYDQYTEIAFIPAWGLKVEIPEEK